MPSSFTRGDWRGTGVSLCPRISSSRTRISPDLVRAEPVTRQSCPVRRLLAFLDPLLGGPALVVKRHDRAIRELEIGHDEADARKQFADAVLDFRHDPSGRGPALRLIPDTRVPNQRLVARSSRRTKQEVFDLKRQVFVRRYPDRVLDTARLQRLVDRRPREGGGGRVRLLPPRSGEPVPGGARPYAVPRRTRRRDGAGRGAAMPAGWGRRRAGTTCTCCAR